jgi:hypothetical protein
MLDEEGEQMTEAEWLTCTDPQQMLEFLRGRLSDRKLRLFACAYYRRIWHLLTEPARLAVDTSERFADGQASADELRQVPAAVAKRSTLSTLFSYSGLLESTAAHVAHLQVEFALLAVESAEDVVLSQIPLRQFDITLGLQGKTKYAKPIVTGQRVKERVVRCNLLRDLFGDPFQPLPAFAPSWLAHKDGHVVKLAQSIYDDRAFDRLPLLADALEEAGCHDADILAHCRQPGDHVRGCWAVDLVLGKT